MSDHGYLLTSDPGIFASAATVLLGICSDQILSKQMPVTHPGQALA